MRSLLNDIDPVVASALGIVAAVLAGFIVHTIAFAIARRISRRTAGRGDDEVIVEGELGWVEEITTAYVIVRLWDLRRMIVPLSYFLEKPFRNWTKCGTDILGSGILYTDYTVPLDALRAELKRIVEARRFGAGRWRSCRSSMPPNAPFSFAFW